MNTSWKIGMVLLSLAYGTLLPAAQQGSTSDNGKAPAHITVVVPEQAAPNRKDLIRTARVW
jgi:hypothetical protein